MKIYIAASLFNEAELHYNIKIAQKIADAGHTIVLPQNYRGNTADIFQQSIQDITNCDAIVAILDGSDTDSGTSFECGFARALGKLIIGVRTDVRENHIDGLNIMLRYGVSMLVTSVDEALDTLASAEKEQDYAKFN